jgi:hypothetical protein
MNSDLLELEPKVKRAKGERCCDPVVYPDVERAQAQRMAAIAKALADPVGLQLVDVLRSTPARCACASWCRCSTSPAGFTPRPKFLR